MDAIAARSNIVTVTPASPAHAYDIAAILRVGSARLIMAVPVILAPTRVLR